MEDAERPRKAQKLDHATGDSDGDGAVVRTGGGESMGKNAEQATESQASPNEAANSRENGDKNETVEAGADTAGKENGDSAAPALSKNKLKKLRRHEKWEAEKEFRKAKKKEKREEKKERKRAARENGIKDSPGAGANGVPEPSAQGPETNKHRTLLPITFILDCGYDELMTEKERTSLASQITRSYSDNSRSPYKGHLMISSFNGMLKERFDTVLRKTHEHWKGVTFTQDDYVAAAEVAKSQMNDPAGGEMEAAFSRKADTNAKEEGEIVYLSSDSAETLTELKPYSTYIIGGLVDRNRHKGVCYKSAMDKGIRTAKLPIGEYMQMNSRFVLATNHVVEIMLKWLELGDWGEAFVRVMPKRKGGALKEKQDEATKKAEQAEGHEAAHEEAAHEEATHGEAADEEAADTNAQGADNN